MRWRHLSIRALEVTVNSSNNMQQASLQGQKALSASADGPLSTHCYNRVLAQKGKCGQLLLPAFTLPSTPFLLKRPLVSQDWEGARKGVWKRTAWTPGPFSYHTLLQRQWSLLLVSPSAWLALYILLLIINRL